jgi:hypothetical protein
MQRTLALSIMLACLAAVSVYAGTCSNPYAQESGMIYNYYYHVPQFCNGTNWVNAGTMQSPDNLGTSPGNFGSAEIGDTNIEANVDSGNANYLEGSPVTLSSAAKLQSLSIYISDCNACNSSEQAIFALYDATGGGGAPGTLLATTTTLSVTQTGWLTANVTTPVELTPGTYWLMSNNNDNSINYQVGQTAGQQPTDYCPYTFGAMPSNFTTGCGGAGNIQLISPYQYSAYGTVTTGCTSPQGNEGDQIYNGAYHTYQFCNGANWAAMELVVSGGGGGGCSNPAGQEADKIYNGAYHTYQFCNGSNWVPFGGAAWTGAPTASTGYFVMSKTQWNGNLGGLSGADSLCLTELTTNTGWKGYGEALADGKLVSGNVHAFGVCTSTSGANTLNANATYYFANANNGTLGGNSFTTNGSGMGPNDSASWFGNSYFGGDYTYWSNIAAGTSTAWNSSTCQNGNGADCYDYTYTGAGYNSPVGESAQSFTGNNRWSGGVADYCQRTYNLICFVNP